MCSCFLYVVFVFNLAFSNTCFLVIFLAHFVSADQGRLIIAPNNGRPSAVASEHAEGRRDIQDAERG